MKRLSILFLFCSIVLSSSFAQRSANVVFIGNSITYGALHQQREQTAPPVQCACWLIQQEEIDTVYFRNCGRSGKTTYHFLPNKADVIPAGDPTYFSDVVSKTRELVNAHPSLPLVFSIMLGTNDSVERKHNSHTTPDNYINNLCTIIDSLLTLWPDAHVVLNKPIWYYPDYQTKGGSIASKKSLKLLDTYYDCFAKIVARCKAGQVHIGDHEAYGYFKSHYKSDVFEEKDARGKSYWLHPNEQGAKQLAAYWGKAILPVINKATPSQATFSKETGNPRKQYLEFIAMPSHADSHYKVGEQASLRITARIGGVPLHDVALLYKTGKEMFLPEKFESVSFKHGEVVIPMGTMQEPGFLACQYEFYVDGKRYGDLVKVGFAPEQIRTLTPQPADFDKFWTKAVSEARKVDFEPEYYSVPNATNEKFLTRLVRLRVGKDKWLYGMLAQPRDGKKHPVVLCPPGAGSTKVNPDDYFPKEGMIYLKIEIHDNDPRIPDDAYNVMRQKKCDGYICRGMQSKDTYYYKDVYVGCVRALDFLCSLPEWDGRNAIVTGGSQGGALTIVTAALNEKATLCVPFYPALCDLLGFRHQRAGGWPKFFSGFYKDGGIDIDTLTAESTLQYFDVVNFASRLKVPTFMSWGYNDDTCSPTSVWAAWNAMTCEKQCDITPSSGHWRFPSSQAESLRFIQTHLDRSSLQGKKIGIIGDSYVRNHRDKIENTWHYKFAQKYGMQYYNYGKNGNCIALDLKQWGTGMYKRYASMNDSLDYIVIIAGHNDASQGRLDSIGVDLFKERLSVMLSGMRKKYPNGQIFFITPWRCENFAGSPRQRTIEAIKEVCAKYDVPVFDASRDSNIESDSFDFRKKYFQGGKGTDTAHLNAKGHDLFLPVAEQFLLQHIK